MQAEQQVNLARKWRSKTFKTIVGQDLALRILQNSLYVNQFFPVYLFSGQKGCGKTTTARVFAAALNCRQLPEFQKNPKVQMPCLECESCVAMQKNQHPDFIEIDAASYTGIDNIRTIIDSSSFLPVLGTKKVYLIDEAHMLSKAAFNAFLKLLEEPPMFVVFILATTDAQKILDTVVSRCFQVFFDPIDQTKIVAHLSEICATEKINYNEDALVSIAKETGGSLRDALNLLEQVRFAGAKVSVDSVRTVLGHVQESVIVDIMHALCVQDAQKLLNALQSIAQKAYGAEYIWQQLIACAYDVVLAHHGIAPKTFAQETVEHIKNISAMPHIIFIFQALCEYEQQVAAHTRKDIVLELTLMRLLYQKGSVQDAQDSSGVLAKKKSFSSEWETFIHKMSSADDVVVVSLFKDATFRHDEEHEKIVISFLKKFEIFGDVLQGADAEWKKIFYVLFPKNISVEYVFDRPSKPIVQDVQAVKTVEQSTVQQQGAAQVEPVNNKVIVQPLAHNTPIARPVQQVPSMYASKKVYTPKIKEKEIDVSDAAVWQTAHALKKIFDGTFVDITEEKG
jgi:DNA polymerase III subunit gamma/tau